ncbi:hypothetical protein [Pseudoalteromonas sp. MMG005]|uniref:hypothetical protein n=1 Tax=Pseudoalteromonas sp. MMG005 TaxID=2822682 RepID=UPI001B3A0CAD|nr:hypothetical protein [Pseudoalteromonas sp. MMG005]
MEVLLYIAACLLIAVAGAHSYLGERYILSRLFKRDNLPTLFGGTEFTRHTLRFAWHLTSIAWCGFAAILFVLAQPSITKAAIANIIMVTFTLHFLMALLGSKAKHLSWLVFLLVALCSTLAVQIG